jgi:hypothetical protein
VLHIGRIDITVTTVEPAHPPAAHERQDAESSTASRLYLRRL